jgi:mannose-1-phosphate guanylyltransferase
MQAVILTGNYIEGGDSRLNYLGPTSLLLLGPQPALHLQIDRLQASGIDEIIIVTGHEGSEFANSVMRRTYKPSIWIVSQPEQLGSAGALKKLERFIHSPTLILRADVFFNFDLRALISAHFEEWAVLTVGLDPGSVEHRPVEHRSAEPGFGNQKESAGNGRKLDWRVLGTGLRDAGVYLIEPDLLKGIPENIKYELFSDLLPRLIEARAPVLGLTLPRPPIRLDSLQTYLECQRWFLPEEGFVHPGSMISSGACLRPPFYIGAGVHVYPWATLGPYAVLPGPAQIGMRAVVENSVVYPGARIGADSSVTSSVIATNGHVRDGAVVESGIVVGPAFDNSVDFATHAASLSAPDSDSMS